MSSTALKGQATPEQIAGWKEKYPQGIYKVEVEGHVLYFRNPTRSDINCALSAADASAPLDMFENFTSGTMIGGSEEALKDDLCFTGISNEVKKKIDGHKATLVNL